MLGDVQGLVDVDAAPLLDTDEAASQKAMGRISPEIRRKAYVGWLGHTNARCKTLGWSKPVHKSNCRGAPSTCRQLDGMAV